MFKEIREEPEPKSKAKLNLIRIIFPNCDRILNTKTSKNEGKFGYIIRNKKYNFISTSINFITNLKYAIENFLLPLHKNNYVLNNIDLSIKYDEQKVYFNFENMKKSDDPKDKENDIKKLISFIKDLYIQFKDNNDEDTNILIQNLNNNNLIDTLSTIIIKINDITNYQNMINTKAYEQKQQKEKQKKQQEEQEKRRNENYIKEQQGKNPYFGERW
jgi:hypothetical protein